MAFLSLSGLVQLLDPQMGYLSSLSYYYLKSWISVVPLGGLVNWGAVQRLGRHSRHIMTDMMVECCVMRCMTAMTPSLRNSYYQSF